ELLVALAKKHLRFLTNGSIRAERANRAQGLLTELSSAVQLWRQARDNFDWNLYGGLTRRYEYIAGSVLNRILEQMEESGILDALDDAHRLVFGHLQRSVIPEEDLNLLVSVGFSRHEVDVLIAIALNE